MSEPRTVLITGAAGGLGRALAIACARGGDRLALVDRNLRELESTCDAVEAAGCNSPTYCQLDLAQLTPAAAAQLVAGIEAEQGPVTALVHCAASFDGLRPLEHVEAEDWQEQMQVNLSAAWLLSVACLGSLKQAQPGQLWFLLNREAAGHAYWGAYGASQAGLQGLATALSEELEGSSCQVRLVDPGPMRTALRAAAYLGEDPSTVADPTHAAAFLADLLHGRRSAGESLLLAIPPA